ncbi:MAG: hypothetical protein JWQ57_781 [Mucilaginibacter sp.]|nr:hypothetical protein [Mucilaginibacter sp.]
MLILFFLCLKNDCLLKQFMSKRNRVIKITLQRLFFKDALTFLQQNMLPLKICHQHIPQNNIRTLRR